MHSIVSFQIIVLSVLVCIDGTKVGKNRETAKHSPDFLFSSHGGNDMFPLWDGNVPTVGTHKEKRKSRDFVAAF
jgi:hypothetical protein